MARTTRSHFQQKKFDERAMAVSITSPISLEINMAAMTGNPPLQSKTKFKDIQEYV